VLAHPDILEKTLATATGAAVLSLVGLAGLYAPTANVWAAAATLASAAVAFPVVADLFVPVIGPLSTPALAAGCVWVGAAMWTGATAADPGIAGPPPATAPRARSGHV
jgi:hypothetical protein